MGAGRESHPFGVALLLVAATLVGAAAICSIWANRQLLDDRGWVATSDRLLRDDQVRERLAVFLVDELEAGLSADQVAELGAVEPELREAAPRLAAQVMATPRFAGIWRETSLRAHATLVRILDEEEPARGAAGDEVVAIDLAPAILEVADEFLAREDVRRAFGLEDDETGSNQVSVALAAGVGRIEIVRADQLDTAQTVTGIVRDSAMPLVLIALALWGAALIFGRRAWGATVFRIGVSLAGAGLLALAIRRFAEERIVDELLERGPDRAAAEAAWALGTSTAVTLAAAAIGLGALVALFAVLLGENGPARGLRRALGRRTGAAGAVAWLALAGLVVWGALVALAPIAALGTPLGAALFGAAIVGGALLLGRRVGDESLAG